MAVGPGGVAVGVLVLVDVYVGVAVLVGNMGSGDGVNDGLRVLKGSGVADGCTGTGVQVASSGGSVAVGVSEGSSIAATSVGKSSGVASAMGMATVGRACSISAKEMSGSRSGATKKRTITVTTATESNSNNAATKLIKRPAQPVCCLCFFAMFTGIT